MYNLIKSLIIGDFLWTIPTILAGIFSILFTFKIANKWIRLGGFILAFLILTIFLHIFIEPYIHQFQAWYRTPLGPSMVLH